MGRQKGSKNKAEKKRHCGIYRIRNIQNEKVYIGSSQYIEGRWYNHKKMLRKGVHHKNKSGRVSHLQHSWNKYGESSFVFEILEECSKEDLLSREQYWFEQYPAKQRYNGTDIAATTRGYKHTKEARQLMSEKASKPKPHKRKPVEQLNRDLEVIATFDSAREAAASNPSFSETKISACCRGVRVSHRDYHWRYIEDEPDRIRTFSARNKARAQCDLDGNIIRIFQTKQELEDAGFKAANVRNVCTGNRATYKGYVWKTVE